MELIILPAEQLQPTSPPTVSLPLTNPEKWQFSIVPLLWPTIPPMVLFSPVGVTTPLTDRSFISAPSLRYLNSP